MYFINIFVYILTDLLIIFPIDHEMIMRDKIEVCIKKYFELREELKRLDTDQDLVRITTNPATSFRLDSCTDAGSCGEQRDIVRRDFTNRVLTQICKFFDAELDFFKRMIMPNIEVLNTHYLKLTEDQRIMLNPRTINGRRVHISRYQFNFICLRFAQHYLTTH
jgi:hypothetical protein